MKIAFLTLGCKLNYAETSTYERGFKAAGLEVVRWQDKADVYLVNTCSVTATSDSKSRNLIRKVHRVNPDALLIVTGCSAQLRRAEIENIEGVTRVFGATEKSLVVPETLSILASCGVGDYRGSHVTTFGQNRSAVVSNSAEEIKNSSIEAGTNREGLSDGAGNAGGKGSSRTNDSCVFAAYSSGERTRSFLKVQDGCNNYCKYCTVPYARGESRNISIAEVICQAKEIAAQGIKEVVLTGVNTGDFGRTTGESFLDLLKALNEVEGIERYRISSIEPNLITEEIVDWIATGTKIQPHFHIPLQTGCDELLEKMGRHYTTEFFRGRMEYIRKKLETPGAPKVFFGIDVMVGLPGETEELFQQTYSFIEKLRPAFIHVFPYSRRPGTPAAEMPGQVPEPLKDERVARLEQLCSRLHAEFVEQNKGVHTQVLFESSNRKGRMEGYTGNYIRVDRPFDESLVNTLVDVIL